MNSLPVPSLIDALRKRGIGVEVFHDTDGSWRVAASCSYWHRKRVLASWAFTNATTAGEVLANHITQDWLQRISGLKLTLVWE